MGKFLKVLNRLLLCLTPLLFIACAEMTESGYYAPVTEINAVSTSIKPMTKVNVAERPPQASSIKKWLRPAHGRMTRFFSSQYKGIDFEGRMGDPVFATAPGKVVYAGRGLRSYGNLIILKHHYLYLSAYAHNRRLLVKEGDFVRQGQKIAEIGNTGTNRPMLYFEIRRAGKPIDPVVLLGSEP